MLLRTTRNRWDVRRIRCTLLNGTFYEAFTTCSALGWCILIWLWRAPELMNFYLGIRLHEFLDNLFEQVLLLTCSYNISIFILLYALALILKMFMWIHGCCWFPSWKLANLLLESECHVRCLLHLESYTHLRVLPLFHWTSKLVVSNDLTVATLILLFQLPFEKGNLSLFVWNSADQMK